MAILRDTAFFVAGLALFTAVGWPVCSALCSSIKGRFWAAPVFGLSLFGVLATVGYRFGLTPALVPLLTVVSAATAMVLLSRKKHLVLPARLRPRAVVLIAAFLCALTLLAMSPKWLGGYQFAAFQGNHYDQANYITGAAAFAKLPYAALAELSPADTLANTYNHFASALLKARPTVAIVLAALRPAFYETTFEAAHIYLTLLQAVTFFAAMFVLRAVFATALLRALAVALTLSVGTYLQLIFDFNAWSQLAATPQALVLVALVAVVFSEPPGWRLTLPLAVSGAGLFYFYPEITVVAGLAALGAALCWSLSLPWPKWRDSARTLGLAAVASLFACALYWRGTIGFVLVQARLTREAAVFPAEWFLYYHRFLLGQNPHAPELILNAVIPAHQAALAALTLPVDFALGALGLYFLSPAPSASRLLWIGLCGAGLAVFLFSLVKAMRCMRTANPAGFAFLVGALLALVAPATLFASGRLWAGGKSMMMAAPLLFFAIAAPLLVPLAARWCLVPLMILAAHLGFGLERPIAALRPNGLHRAFPPYPTIMDKAKFDWDLPRHKATLRACSAASLDIADPVLDRVAQTFVSDLGLRWYSRRPLRSYYEQGIDFGNQVPLLDANCLLTDSEGGETNAGTTVRLRR